MQATVSILEFLTLDSPLLEKLLNEIVDSITI